MNDLQMKTSEKREEIKNQQVHREYKKVKSQLPIINHPASRSSRSQASGEKNSPDQQPNNRL
jgi:hypothetical protein